MASLFSVNLVDRVLQAVRSRLPAFLQHAAALYLVFAGVALTEVGALYLFFSPPVVEATIRKDQIRPYGGYAYMIAPPAPSIAYRVYGNTVGQPKRSDLMLFQDGEPLGPPHASHDTISERGAGLYISWQRVLAFSTSDNSDPRTNGRTYTYWVTATPSRLLYGTVIAASIGFVVLLWLVLARQYALSRSNMVLALKVAALAVISGLAPWLWLGRMSATINQLIATGEWLLLGSFILGAAISLLALSLVPFFRDWRLRLILTLVALAGFALDQLILNIARHHVTMSMVEVLWRNKDMAQGAALSYASPLGKIALLTALLSVAMLIPPPQKWAVRTRFALIPLVGFALVYAVVLLSNGRVEAFPSPFAVPAQFLAVQTSAAAGARTEADRWPVNYNLPIKPMAKKIVMVVDESVRGDYLQLNDQRFDNSPFLVKNARSIANYGVAISGANCSEAARLFLRIGLRPHQLPDTAGIWTRLQSIWQYAQTAGYRTVLIDAFRANGEYHSYMNRKEAEHIDTYIPIVSEPSFDRDTRAADALIDLLKRDEPLLIYVNKYGIHPPYNASFPPEAAYQPRFLSPVQPVKGRVDIIKDYQLALIGDYHRAVRWSVDRFFEKIFPAVLQNGATLIYSSDHGQSLFESGYDLSHCSWAHNLNLGEVYVPLFAVSGDEGQRERFRSAARDGYNQASHFEIFPTLLRLMGYADDWVELAYGPNLWNVPKNAKRGFLMGTFYQPGAVWLDAKYPR